MLVSVIGILETQLLEKETQKQRKPHISGALGDILSCSSPVSRTGMSGDTQIARAPRNGFVTNCYKAENGHVWGNFSGQTGYILQNYLELFD